MGTRDSRIDAYIANSAEFAKPILSHLRGIVHQVCPEVEETLKWRHPHFMYEGMLCGMAAFKEHCAFGFWKGSLIVNQEGQSAEQAMRQLGRITRLSDLPARSVLARYVRQAMRLNDAGIKLPKPSKPKTKKPVVVPEDLTSALRRNKKARASFESFSPSHQREYVEWITEAKSQETRSRRLETAIDWLADGKPRHWKYMKRPAGRMEASRGASH